MHTLSLQGRIFRGHVRISYTLVIHNIRHFLPSSNILFCPVCRGPARPSMGMGRKLKHQILEDDQECLLTSFCSQFSTGPYTWVLNQLWWWQDSFTGVWGPRSYYCTCIQKPMTCTPYDVLEVGLKSMSRMCGAIFTNKRVKLMTFFSLNIIKHLPLSGFNVILSTGR